MPHAPTDVDALANLIEQADNWPAELVGSGSGLVSSEESS
jgi:hypothetical protein